MKRAGSLRLPLFGSGSPAKPSRAGSLAAAAHKPLEPWPVHGPAPTALRYTQMARLLIGSRALHFHWWSASGSGGSHLHSENTQMQRPSPVSMCVQPVRVSVSVVGAMM